MSPRRVAQTGRRARAAIRPGCKVDLHTHSYGSPDGGLRLRDYRQALEQGLLDFIAITDHDNIATALHIQDELGSLGGRIIVGEEIMTSRGEIIGLYLSENIRPGLTPAETIRRIRQQAGLVYVPHPFETVRSGLTQHELDSIASGVDIIEVRNGRAIFQNRGPQAIRWAASHDLPAAAASDSHGRLGWCRTYTIITEAPTSQNLVKQLGTATFAEQSVGLGVLYPKLNRMRSRAER